MKMNLFFEFLLMNIGIIGTFAQTTTPDSIDQIQVCAAKADVVVILDHSGSIEEDQFAELTKFVGFVANLLQISENGTRLGVVSYSASAKIEFNLNEIYNITEYRERAKAELSRDPNSFQTNHFSGLKAAADLLNDTSKGAREGVVKLMIFTTDGANNFDPPDQDRGRALRFANEFKASSNASRIFVIKAEVLSDRDTQLDSRLYSTDPNIYFRFIPDFGEITKGDFLKNVSLDFCELVKVPGNEQGVVPENEPAGTFILTINRQGLPNPMYQLVAGQDVPFTVGQTSGQVKTSAVLDREVQEFYSFQVKVTDPINPNFEKIITVEITVLDVNDNDPNPAKAVYNVTIFDNVTINTEILKIEANDQDLGLNGMVTYTLLMGGDGKFSLNSTTGQITVIGMLDARMQNFYKLYIKAQDSGSITRSANITVNIFVLAVNMFPPEFLNSPFSVTIKENHGMMNLVINATAIDRDGDPVSYSLLNPSGMVLPFSIDQNGIITVNGSIDFETIASPTFTFQVQAYANGDTTIANVTIVIANINDNTPAFGQQMYTGSINENSPQGTNVTFGQPILAIDNDKVNNAITYSISGTIFGVSKDAQGQAVIFLQSPSLDHEVQSQYILTLIATDSGTDPGTLSSNVSVTINVIDVNDKPPMFSKNAYIETILENATIGHIVIAELVAMDEDTPVDQLTFSMTLGLPFKINETTGAIYVNGSLDFETTSQYNFTVFVSDSVNVGSAPFTVNIADVNDVAPMFVAPINMTFDIDEGNFTNFQIFVFSAVDGDGTSPNNQIMFSLPNAPGKFSIVTNQGMGTGSLMLSGILDAEGMNPQYTFTVRVSDMGNPVLYSEINVTINVLDVNEFAPVFDPVLYNVSIDENSPNGTFVLTVTATDADLAGGVNSMLMYVITNGGVPFNINAENGTITVDGYIDFESNTQYIVYINASDKGSPPKQGQAIVTVNVNDLNDNAPVFQSADSISIPENTSVSTIIHRFMASDVDFLPVVYLLKNYSDGVFQLYPNGDLKLLQPLDFESVTSYTLMVYAVDNNNTFPGALQTMQTFTIYITDVNDVTPTFMMPTYVKTVSEDHAVGTAVLQLMATDNEMGVNGMIMYSILMGDGTFVINMTTGLITLAMPLDFETQNYYQFQVEARDKGNPSLASTAIVKINVTNKNEHPPIIQGEPIAVTIDEERGIGFVVVVINATDADGDALTYELIGPVGNFTINSTTGVITTLRNFDFEMGDSSFMIMVKVSDSSLEDTAPVVVTINNINDNDPVFDPNVYNLTISENMPVGSIVVTVMATDIDQVDVNDVMYSILSGANGDFVIDPASGVITVNQSLDFDVINKYTLTVQAEDKGPGASRTSTVNVTIYIAENKAPMFIPSTRNATVVENVNLGIIIHALTVEDCDLFAPNMITFSFAQSNPSNPIPFAINNIGQSTNGMITTAVGGITVTGPVDFEQNPSYTVGVIASDGDKESTFTLTITIIDENEAPTIVSPASVDVLENTTVGTTIYTLVAQDPDNPNIPNSALTYAIVGSNFGTFEINSTTGEITLTSELDAENITTYTLLLSVADGGTTPNIVQLNLQVNVINVNEAPVITNAMLNICVLENKANESVINITAIDPEGDVLQYSLSGSDAAAFYISSSGEIKTVNGLDREMQDLYNFTVTVSDGELSDSKMVTVCVLDENDTPPIIMPVPKLYVDENSPIGTVVVQVNATDLDQNTMLTFSLSYNGTDLPFMINSNGVITVNGTVDFESKNMYMVTVNVSDGVNANSIVIMINVNDLNEPPVVNDVNAVVKIFTAVNETVATVVAMDNDAGSNGMIEFSIVDGNMGDHFQIDPMTGVISIKNVITSLMPPSFNLTIKAEDKGWPRLSDNATVFVMVMDNPNLVICNCTLPNTSYPCLKWTKYEIIRQFNGSCYVDKLKAAIYSIKNKTAYLMALKSQFESCKMDLQGRIVAPGGANVTELFSRLDVCVVNTQCKIQRWIMQLEQKTNELEQQLKAEQEGYTGFDLPGFEYFNYLKNLMSMSQSSRGWTW